MTTPTIDSQLTGQTSGTIKIPDYSESLGNLASLVTSLKALTAVAFIPAGNITTIAGVGTLVFPAKVGDEVAPGMQLTGTNVLPGTFIVSGSGLTWTLNQPQTVVGAPMVACGALVSIASSSSAIGNTLSTFATTATTVGVKAYDPFDLVGKASSYAYLADNAAELTAIAAKLPSIPKPIMEQIKALMHSSPQL